MRIERSMLAIMLSGVMGVSAAASLPGVAHAADEAASPGERAAKHQAIMNSGKTTHEDAWAATNRTQDPAQVQDKVKKHEQVMRAGKTSHEDAWRATNRDVSPADAARMRAAARKHQELMNQGKPHEQAWQATDADERAASSETAPK